MKRYESNYNPTVKDISDYIHDNARNRGIDPVMATKIKNVLDGIEVTDNLLVQKDNVINQKTTELQSKENLLAQKEQLLVQKDKNLEQLKKIGVVDVKEEFIVALEQENMKDELKKVLPELFRNLYPKNFNNWPPKIWGREVIENNKIDLIEKWLPIYKEQLAKHREFIKIVPKLYPGLYPINFDAWPPKIWGREVIENNKIDLIEKWLPEYKRWLANKEEIIKILPKLYPVLYSVNFEDWTNQPAKVLLDKYEHQKVEDLLFSKWRAELEAKELLAQKENELKKLAGKDQLLNDREQEIAKIKEMLSIKELETQNKDQLLLAKELEKQELVRQKEIEKEELLAQQELEKKELLAQKEVELANKSLVKNQFIGELQGELGLKEKDALNLKIESLMKQLEFKAKEVELKDKALEDANEIVKQNKIINELKGKLLAFKDLSKGDETLQLELSVIHFKVEESILNGNVDEMKELSKYLSQLMKEPADKDESLDISELLNNLSPVHVQENLVQNPVAVINNFDINHINTTHSVYPSGEGSSFDIIQEESFH